MVQRNAWARKHVSDNDKRGTNTPNLARIHESAPKSSPKIRAPKSSPQIGAPNPGPKSGPQIQANAPALNLWARRGKGAAQNGLLIQTRLAPIKISAIGHGFIRAHGLAIGLRQRLAARLTHIRIEGIFFIV